MIVLEVKLTLKSFVFLKWSKVKTIKFHNHSISITKFIQIDLADRRTVTFQFIILKYGFYLYLFSIMFCQHIFVLQQVEDPQVCPMNNSGVTLIPLITKAMQIFEFWKVCSLVTERFTMHFFYILFLKYIYNFYLHLMTRGCHT